MSVFETRADCPPVEAFLWDAVAKDYGGYFGGVRQLSPDNLAALRDLCERQLKVAASQGEDSAPPLDSRA